MPLSRVALVVSDLEAARAFYGARLGLRTIAEFEDHDGWSGVLFAFPDDLHQLEVTVHSAARPSPGGEDDLLVLWLASQAIVEGIAREIPPDRRCRPANPWWHGRSETVMDPDGHRVTLAW